MSSTESAHQHSAHAAAERPFRAGFSRATFHPAVLPHSVCVAGCLLMAQPPLATFAAFPAHLELLRARVANASACSEARTHITTDRPRRGPMLAGSSGPACEVGIARELRQVRTALDALQIDAKRSLLLPGSSSGLRARLQRCLVDESSSLVIKVLGNSMTHGSMNCRGAPPYWCSNHIENGSSSTEHLRWAAGLQKMLQRALPCHVHVPVKDSGGVGSAYYSQPSIFRKSVDAADDVVIADWSISDASGRPQMKPGSRDFEAAEELFVRELRTVRPHSPFLVHMEAYPDMGSTPMQCDDETQAAPRAVCEHYGVPLISFMRAVCSERDVSHRSREPALRHWRAACSRDGNHEAACSPVEAGGCGVCGVHPGPTTHRIYALLLAHYFLGQAAVACSVPQEELPAAPNDAGPSWLPLKQLQLFQGCSVPMANINLRMFGCGAPPWGRPIASKGWHCFEDRPGKPGWIATANASHKLAFTMPMTREGSIIVSFLRSYHGMANASVALAGLEGGAEVVLEGAWRSRTSQEEFRVIPVAELAGASAKKVSEEWFGPRRVHRASRLTVVITTLPPAVEGQEASSSPSHADGAPKFKLTSLTSC